MEDDYGTSYYFRGAVENNYVKFAGFYWRIIRINGDGTIRMIFDGAYAYRNGIANDNRFTHRGIYFDDVARGMPKGAGYMYSPAGNIYASSAKKAQTNNCSSTIKTLIDEWYKTNILDKGYHNYVADSIFCNDRTIVSGPGYGSSSTKTTYGSYNRETNPSFVSPNNNVTGNINNDKFTVNDTKNGNGALTYPVALITADEIVAAGACLSYTGNKKYYLYRSTTYDLYSMSPECVRKSANGGVRIYCMVANGRLLSIDDISSTPYGAIAPVINLKANIDLVGTGTMTDPYRLKTETL